MKADGVFSGGGIKGLAFAGGLKAAAEAGYTEWGKLGGTSAGAITAMALAVGYDAKGLQEQMDAFDFSKIADYGTPAIVAEAKNFLLHHGLTHGEVLHHWIGELLANAPRPATKFGELERDRLRVVGVDLAHSRMVVFPEDVGLYVDENDKPLVPDEYPIADAVRISAGYPYFFPPMKLRDAQTKTDGALVDGGIAASFPVFLFDQPEPEHPTWGFRLFGGTPPEQPPYQPIDGPDWAVDMIKGILDTSINALDKLELKSFGDRVIAIPTGAVPTLEFALNADQKAELFDNGYNAAKSFFDGHPSGRNTFGVTPPTAVTPTAEPAGIAS
jgi:NTE family protein